MSESKEQQHTPLPWLLADHDFEVVVSGDGTVIADTWRRSGHIYPKPIREANARFIFRAVNSHEALVEALQFALRESGCDGDLCNYRWHEKARAALALAEKES